MLVRYCDDLVVLRSEKEAEGALSALTAILHGLGLEPKPSKTRIVHLVEGGEGLDFLGYHHRWVSNRSSGPRTTGATSPAGPRDRPCSVPEIVFVISRCVVGYCCRLKTSWEPESVPPRLGRVLSLWEFFVAALHRHQVVCADAPGTFRGQTPRAAPGLRPLGGRGCLGQPAPAWSACPGSSLHHDPTGRGGGDRMPAVNGVGEPCAGEPHARFDGRALEKGQPGGDLRVPGRCAERCRHDDLVGTQPIDPSLTARALDPPHLSGSPGQGQVGILRELHTGHERQGEEGEGQARSGTGTSTVAVARTSLVSPGASTPRSEAGSTTTGPYRSALYSIAWHIDQHLVRWVMRKFKRLRGKHRRAWDWLVAAKLHRPQLSLIGISSPSRPADLQEPDELRGSRPVL